jgi:hypothetical protein
VDGQYDEVLSVEQLAEQATALSLVARHRIEVIPASDVGHSLVPDPPPTLHMEGTFANLVLGAIPSVARKPPTKGEHLHIDSTPASPHSQALECCSRREDRGSWPAASDPKRADERDRLRTVGRKGGPLHDNEAALVYVSERGTAMSG